MRGEGLGAVAEPGMDGRQVIEREGVPRPDAQGRLIGGDGLRVASGGLVRQAEIHPAVGVLGLEPERLLVGSTKGWVAVRP